MIGERAVDTVVLLDGDLPSVVALNAIREEMEVHRREAGATAQATGRVAVCAIPWNGPLGAVFYSAIHRLADVDGLPKIEVSMPDFGSSATPGMQESAGLLMCAYAAAAAGYSRVVWPCTAGAGEGVDIDRAAAIMDRAVLCGRLVAIDAASHGRPGIHIETPYADLSDRQIADLALDLAVPLEGCWWWPDRETATDSGAELARARWMPRLMDMGYVSRQPLKA